MEDSKENPTNMFRYRDIVAEHANPFLCRRVLFMLPIIWIFHNFNNFNSGDYIRTLLESC